MPGTFTRRAQRLTDGSPLITIAVGPGVVPSRGPRPDAERRQTVRALLDTGANRTIMIANTPFHLGLKAVETFEVQGEVREAFSVRLWWDRTHSTELVVIEGREPLIWGFQAIIGRDVLDQGLLTYDGRNGTYDLEIDCT